MVEFKGLDYDKYPKATNEVAKFIEQRLKSIINGPVAKEYVEIIMIYTSKNYTGDWNKVGDELAEAFEVG